MHNFWLVRTKEGGKLPYTTHSDPDGLGVLLESWRTLGLPKEEMDLCLRVVSAILHLGNLVFKQSPDEKSTIENPKVAEIAASELGVDVDQLAQVITMKLTETSRDRLWSPVREAQAKVNRDSIAKQIYAEFFDRLITILNERLAPPDETELGADTKFRTIALLDIYGFENLPTNSLEQFCINYTNENLQRFFNFYIFELEQEEYRKEHIDWQYIEFPDNQPIIQLIAERPNGIIHICNDEASLATGTDRSFLERSQQLHRGHPNFGNPKVGGSQAFAIVHFAGQITYTVDGFVDKNREQMRSEVLNLLVKSRQPAVSSMFQVVQARRTNAHSAGRTSRTPMVLAAFNSSLQELLNKMKRNRPHFVRCIKPNMSKAPMTFEDSIVLDQLRYTGVLEATRIRKSGFPVRPSYQDFVDRYGFLIAKNHRKKLRSLENPKEAACYLLNHLDISVGEGGIPKTRRDYELGDTKLFMRNRLAVDLDAICTMIQHRSARIIQEAWRRRGDGLYERARQNAATVIQAYFRGYLARQQNPNISRVAAQRAPVEIEPEEPVQSLSDLEIARLEIPSDLAFILEERSMDESSWLETHKVTRPRGSIRRLVSSHPAGGWQTYGRPVWDAQPLSYLMNGRLGFRLAPRTRPIMLTQATEGQKAAAAAASKLVLRLIHLPEQPIMDQYLIGSYLYQLGLVNKSLHKEILAQLLSQSVDWPNQAGMSEESDKEDEASLFESDPGRAQTQRTYSISEGNVDGVIRDRNPIGKSDLERRAFRRLWMHVAGVLTCGRLSGTLKPVIVRFMRQHGPARSVPLCEDRLVMAPSVARLYPPCLLEWRANYTGSNMGIGVKFPDGLSSVTHVGCFTRAETLAGLTMALRARAVHALPGWTMCFITPTFFLDVPGYCYVMDVFSALELPPLWSHLNKILPDHVFPTYLYHTTNPQANAGIPSGTGYMGIKNDWSGPSQPNGVHKPDNLPGLDAEKLAATIHGIEMNDSRNRTVLTKPPISPSSGPSSNLRGSWGKAVRKMALKRFGDVSRSESTLRRVHSRRQRLWRSSDSPFFPRPKSPTDIAADARVNGAPPDSPLPPDGTGTRKSLAALPHEMRYYVYERPNCSVQIRKEFISPKERIRSSLVLTLMFSQVVSDANTGVNPRLRADDRQTILSMVGDRYISNWPESLQEIPLDLKKRVVSQSLKFPLYFGRLYPILYLDHPISENDCHWLVVAHHGVRVVFQNHDRPEFDLHTTLELGDILSVDTNHVVARPRWRLGDVTQSEHPRVAGYLSSETKPVDVVGGLKNMLEIKTKDKTYQFYSDMAERIKENVVDFLKEYEQEMQRLKQSAEKRALRSALDSSVAPAYIELSSNSQSIPDLSRYPCSPPLFTSSLSQRDSATLIRASPFPSYSNDAGSTFSKLSSTSPKRLSSDAYNSDTSVSLPTINQSTTLPQSPVASASLSPPVNPNVSSTPPPNRTAQIPIRDDRRSTPSMTPINQNVERLRQSSASVTIMSASRSPDVSAAPESSHPLAEYASQHFANKQNITEQLTWQPELHPFKALLPHHSVSDEKDSQTIFSLILKFCQDERTEAPPYMILRSLIGLLSKRPWMNDELYCLLVKQTYRNRSRVPNGTEQPWILWALVSIFVETSDDLRPHLIRYTQSSKSKENRKIYAAIQTIDRSMELVKRFGSRKHLPPDDALKLLASGELYHRQQVNLPNRTGLLATVGQLSLVRDAIRGLVDQLNPHTDKLCRDFSLYLAPKTSRAATFDEEPLIPLSLDSYLLDFPVYDQTYALHFRRLCWTVKMDVDRISQPTLNYLFDQVSEDYLSGYWLVQTEPGRSTQLTDECALISCLMFQGRDQVGPVTRSSVSALVPHSLDVDPDEWRSKINKYLTMSKCGSASEARSKFLSRLEKWQLFGSAVFYARLKSIPPGFLRNFEGQTLSLIALSQTGVVFVNPRTREILQQIRYEDVASTKVNFRDESDRNCNGLVTLTTSNGQQLALLLAQVSRPTVEFSSKT
ncbi:Myosin-XV [Fasciola gigantica]|uniref:Myosin-XV n=1 Tax=Fasciola gigantica TaxID=46835 RepID=A0A504Z065_FASGI|nr:Myosin-XV [Fasciola gigantica]